MLGFDPKDTHKYNFSYEIQNEGDSTFITIKKERTKDFFQAYAKSRQVGDMWDAIQFDGYWYAGLSQYFTPDYFSTAPDNSEETVRKGYERLSTSDYSGIGNDFNSVLRREYDSEGRIDKAKCSFESYLGGKCF